VCIYAVRPLLLCLKCGCGCNVSVLMGLLEWAREDELCR